MKKKGIAVLGMVGILSLSMNLTSMAAQSDRWTEQSGTWYLKNEQGTGNIVNSWFQDLDSSWYLLAPGDGHMYAGLIHDTLTDRWYFCQTEHNGWYGKLAHTDGLYTVNGQQVHLTFTQEHNGYFGAITSGLEGLMATGIVTQDVAGLPTESASASSSNNIGNQPPEHYSDENFDYYYINGVYEAVPKDKSGDNFNPSQEFLDMMNEMNGWGDPLGGF